MVPTKHHFPESFFEEEDRLGFHIDRQRKEIWAIELDMLYELDRVCKKWNLSYFLECGTLIGAARDGHFIPWDDDIDVCMLREDYDRLLRLGPQEFSYPYFLQTGYTEEGYLRGHSQLRRSDTCAILPEDLKTTGKNQGMFLDIFVADDVFPEKLEEQYRKKEKLFRERKVWNHHNFHPNPIRWAVRWCRYLLYQLRYPNSACFYKKWEEIFRSPEKSEYVDFPMYFDREEIRLIPRALLEKTVDIPFEDGVFPVPAGYREHLPVYYGEDWETPRELPSTHNANGQLIIDTNRSYLEVLQEYRDRENGKST